MGRRSRLDPAQAWARFLLVRGAMHRLLPLCVTLAIGCFGSGGGDDDGSGGTPQPTGGMSAAGETASGGTSGGGGAAGMATSSYDCTNCTLVCSLGSSSPCGTEYEGACGCAGAAGTGASSNCGGGGACPSGQQCCPQGDGVIYCVPAGTCRPGRCASPDTPIATPSGERAIAELREGDLVWSVDHGVVAAVPIVATGRHAVTSHAVVHVELDSGRTFEMSAGHPTADGRTLGVLAPGDTLGDARVESVSMVPYPHPFTYDILPASNTGAYFASGALVGSTLVGTKSGGAR